MENSRGKANYVYKCKMCERTGSVEYQINTCKLYMADKNEDWQTVASFDCRGCELIEFIPANGFGTLGIESNTPFGSLHGQEPIEFDSGDWCAFDEPANEAVGVYGLKSRFIASKKK